MEAGGCGSVFQERRRVTREAEVRAAEHSNSLWRVLLSRGSYGPASEPAIWGRTAREVGWLGICCRRAPGSCGSWSAQGRLRRARWGFRRLADTLIALQVEVGVDTAL